MSIMTNTVTLTDDTCEMAVIGAILCNRDAVAATSRILTAEDFESRFHAFLYQAMLDMWSKGEPVDIVTLSSEMWRRYRAMTPTDQTALNMPSGGEGYLAACIVECPATCHVEWYARRVLDMADRRRMDRVVGDTATGVYQLDTDLDEVVTAATEGLQAARHMPPSGRYTFIGDVSDDASYPPLPRLRLGRDFAELDAITGGFEPGQMIVVAARPSVGKSAIVLQWLYGYCDDHAVPVGLISLEMHRRDLVNRVMAMGANVDMHAIRGGMSITPEQHRRVREVRERLTSLPFAIDDDPDTTLTGVLARSRAMASEQKIVLLGIDYLQLISSPGRDSNRVQEVSKISAAMKQLARELRIPIIVLAQLNRGVEFRPDAEPRLSDLRDSGSIEQDADVVVLLHRVDAESGSVRAIVAKNRNGPTGWSDLIFDKPTASFRTATQPRVATT